MLRSTSSALILLALSGCRPEGPPLLCQTCTISLEYLTTIGGTGTPGSFAGPPRISRDSHGQYIAITPDQPGPLQVFDSTGRFLREQGREGDGPGEYREPRAVLVDTRDSVFILDAIGRITVLSPSLELVRTTPIPGPRPSAYDAVLLPGRGYAFDSQRDSSPPLHAYSFDGQQLAHFGNPQPNCRGCVRYAYRIASASNGSIWAVQAHYRYLGTRWDANGTLLDSGMVNSPWFAPYDSIMSPAPDREPQAHVWSIWQDRSGLLWVLGATGAHDWPDGLGEARTGEEGGARYYPIKDMAAVFDGIIEILEPATWSIVARRRLENTPFLQAIRPGVVASLRETSEGWWQAEVYRVELTGLTN